MAQHKNEVALVYGSGPSDIRLDRRFLDLGLELERCKCGAERVFGSGSLPTEWITEPDKERLKLSWVAKAQDQSLTRPKRERDNRTLSNKLGYA